jgi:hypothetical protein
MDTLFLLFFFFLMIGILFFELRLRDQMVIFQILAMYVVFSIFLYSNLVSKPYIRKGLGLFFTFAIFLFALYTPFQLINLYEMGHFPLIRNICEGWMGGICPLIEKMFFMFKGYRFITLSITFFSLLFMLSGGLWFISTQYERIRRFFHNKAFFEKTCLVIFFIGMLFQFHYGFYKIYQEGIFTLKARNLTAEERLIQRLGGTQEEGWIVPYSKFILRHTEEHSSLFVPPQRFPWASEGNTQYFQYFVFPRVLFQSSDSFAKIDPQVDYILIADGSSSRTEGDEKGWPKVFIPKENIEYIWLIDRKTQEEEQMEARDYVPQSFVGKWGLIKVRR